jgi:hypothetical protein
MRDKDFDMPGMPRREITSSVKNEIHSASEVHKMNIPHGEGQGRGIRGGEQLLRL